MNVVFITARVDLGESETTTSGSDFSFGLLSVGVADGYGQPAVRAELRGLERLGGWSAAWGVHVRACCTLAPSGGHAVRPLATRRAVVLHLRAARQRHRSAGTTRSVIFHEERTDRLRNGPPDGKAREDGQAHSRRLAIRRMLYRSGHWAFRLPRLAATPIYDRQRLSYIPGGYNQMATAFPTVSRRGGL